MAVMLLTACGPSIQTTSGSDYLARHPQAEAASFGSDADYQQRLHDAANVEPTLTFPARIGLARIERGQLTNIPSEEMEQWSHTAETLGNQFGEFVPLNLLVVKMMEHPSQRDSADNIIKEIRLGAARQHLDAVFIYEVEDKRDRKANLMAVTDVTIIGQFIFPSRELKSDVLAAGLLVDVMTGYPYAQVRATSSKEELSNESSSQQNAEELSVQAKALAVEKLAHESADTLISLQQKLNSKKL